MSMGSSLEKLMSQETGQAEVPGRGAVSPELSLWGQREVAPVGPGQGQLQDMPWSSRGEQGAKVEVRADQEQSRGHRGRSGGRSSSVTLERSSLLRWGSLP